MWGAGAEAPPLPMHHIPDLKHQGPAVCPTRGCMYVSYQLPHSELGVVLLCRALRLACKVRDYQFVLSVEQSGLDLQCLHCIII